MLRVMICDESPGDAAALRRVLEHDGDISIVARGASADEALALLGGTLVDLIVIGARLPAMKGLEAVEEIMSSHPLPILVMLPTRGRASDEAAAALAAGAVDAVSKDEVSVTDPASGAGAAFRDRVRLLARAKVIRHPRARLRRQSAVPGGGRSAAAIGICASTGGPQILATMLGALPPEYPIPLLVVQHISEGFTEALASWLDLASGVPVRVAEQGEPANAGAWLAPEDADLRLGPAGRLDLDRGKRAGKYRPSGDVLLSSIADQTGPGGIAVVLSGMGTDGARGAAEVQRAGGFAIAQDARSSVVYGMPRAAAESGVNLVLSPAEISTYLASLRYQPLAGTS